MTEQTIAPHGGTLVDRLADETTKPHLREVAHSLPQKRLTLRELCDLELIAIGGYSPLDGFLAQRDYESVVDHMRLASGVVWSLPITLAATAEEAKQYHEGKDVALVNESGDVVALLHLHQKYSYDRTVEAAKVFRTTDPSHPGVAALLKQGDVLLGGPVTVLERSVPSAFPRYNLSPAQTRQAFVERAWRTVVGFQTRNPVHRAHEYIQKTALETVDGLLLHPLVGETKSDDIPADVRMRCYETLLAGYYPKDRVLLAALPAPMRYAGPREAIHHAVVRKNYGCTHFIVGRDHAGVGAFYGTYDAQLIFREIPPDDLGIQPLFFENSFFCKTCGAMASTKTCPHPAADRLSLSGTAVRGLLRNGQVPPPEFTRPEVAKVLMEHARSEVKV